jgi:hypothetical protein
MMLPEPPPPPPVGTGAFWAQMRGVIWDTRKPTRRPVKIREAFD